MVRKAESNTEKKDKACKERVKVLVFKSISEENLLIPTLLKRLSISTKLIRYHRDAHQNLFGGG